jgi:photosystem II stability/assembly factor-like uncharacterized protein
MKSEIKSVHSRVDRVLVWWASLLRVSTCACVLLLCLGWSLPAAAGDWTAIPLETSGTIYAIGNTYLSNHWVVGANGFVARSNVDRTQWTTLDPRTTADLYSVLEPTGFEVWLGGAMGVVRMNLYAGWFERDLPSQLDFRLFTRRGGQCTAVGPGGLMFRWVSGFWAEIETGVAVDLNGGAGIPTGPAWVIGDDGTILRSNDGSTWDQIESGTTADLYGIVELDLTNLYAVGEAGTILKSTDAGSSWSPRESGTTSTLRAISISKSNPSALLAVGLGGTVLRSTDAGNSWCHLEVTTADLYTAEAYTDLEFFVGGAGGLLLRTTNGGGSCGAASVDAQSPPVSFSISGPFPQPSTNVATLRVSVDRERSFRTDIFDLAGRCVFTSPEWRATSTGENVIALETGDLSSGVYFVRVRGSGVEALRRLVITR